MPKCSSCGAELFPGSKYCRSCGAAVVFDAYKTEDVFDEDIGTSVNVASDKAAAAVGDPSLERLSDEQDALSDSMSPKDKAKLLEGSGDESEEDVKAEDAAPSSLVSDKVSGGELEADITPDRPKKVHHEEMMPAMPVLEDLGAPPKPSEPKVRDERPVTVAPANSSGAQRSHGEKNDDSFSSFGWSEDTDEGKKPSAVLMIAIAAAVLVVGGVIAGIILLRGNRVNEDAPASSVSTEAESAVKDKGSEKSDKKDKKDSKKSEKTEKAAAEPVLKSYEPMYDKAMGLDVFAEIEPDGTLSPEGGITVTYKMEPAADAVPMAVILWDGSSEYTAEPEEYDNTEGRAFFGTAGLEKECGIKAEDIRKITLRANGRQIEPGSIDIEYGVDQ